MTSEERASDLIDELDGVSDRAARWEIALRHLDAEAQDAIDAEREACARLAEEVQCGGSTSVALAKLDIAAAIRARGS
jgi:hypothetical protein